MACVAIRQPVAAKGSIRRASVEESWKRMPALSSSSKLRGGAAQAAVQAFRSFFEWLTGRGLRHVHGGRAVAPYLLMQGPDAGPCHGKRLPAAEWTVRSGTFAPAIACPDLAAAG